LGYFIRHLLSTKFILLATSRVTEGNPGLTILLQTLIRDNRLARIPLSALSRSDMQDMAASLSPTHNTPLSNWLTENAEGNPFFLTELIHFAYGTGLLQTDGTFDREFLNSSLILPPTIQNLIESRLLRLSETARQVLHLAAIIGREFDYELVERAASLSDSQTLDAIEELQSARLIQPLRHAKFAFDHSLTMQVVRLGLNEIRQRSLHRRVAEALEATHQAQLSPAAGLIAHHLIEGNLPSRAVHFLVLAGKFSASLAAWIEAIAFYEQALAIETDETHFAEIYLDMGTARVHKGEFASATRDFQMSVQLARTHNSLPLLEAAHIALNQSFLPQARYAEAINLAEELRLSGPSELALCAEFIWGTGLGVESAHPIEAEYHLREAERLFDEERVFPSRITLAQINYQLAGALGQQGRRTEAIQLFRKALELVHSGQSTIDLLRNIMLYNNLAYQLHLAGDPSASDYTKAGIQVAREKGSLSHLPYLYSTSGEIALAQGDFESAEKFFRDGLSLAKRVPVPERIAGLTANLGLVALRRGDDHLAREHLDAALELTQQLGARYLEVRIRIWINPLLSEKEAKKNLENARTLAEYGGLRSLLEEISDLTQKNSSN
jgi:predicted ATPase